MVIGEAAGICRIYRRCEGEVTRLVLKGALDVRSTRALGSALERAVRSGPSRVVVDISGLKLIDAAGVRTLLALSRPTGTRGGIADLTGARGQPLVVLRLFRWDHTPARPNGHDAAPSALVEAH